MKKENVVAGAREAETGQEEMLPHQDAEQPVVRAEQEQDLEVDADNLMILYLNIEC